MTNETLQEFVDRDTKEHELKDIAQLLLDAMRDWPSKHIEEDMVLFVEEVKKYFGEPVTLEKIKEKKIDGSNAWQLEAGASIESMIIISSEFFHEDDLDKIVGNILKYYKLGNTDL